MEKMNQFMVKVLAQTLLEKEQALKSAYIEANDDKDREQTIKDWSGLDGQE